MKIRRWKRLLLIASCLMVLIAATAATWLYQKVEYQRINSPDERYTAIVTYRRIESFRPSYPGQSGDRAGFIKIEDTDGKNYGSISIPMVWMSNDLEWTDGGAHLKLVCDWNFVKREYRFWNESQTEEITKRAK